MTFEIKPAERNQEKMRLGLSGPSGSGKTLGALKVAHGLCGDWSKVVIIDTENRSGVLYTGIHGIGQYHHLQFNPPYQPYRFLEAISACENAGYEVIIIDSVSHLWIGQDGCLQLVERHSSKPGGKFGSGWKEVTPEYEKFLDKIRFSKSHIIACVRAKQEHALVDDGTGRKIVQKLGMAPRIRDDFEYEMTTSLELTMEHYAYAGASGKDRTGIFDGKPPEKLTSEHGRMLLEWCNTGSVITEEERIKMLQAQIREIIDVKKIPLDNVIRITGIQGTEGCSEEVLKDALLKLRNAS